jgi:hypothetical protein
MEVSGHLHASAASLSGKEPPDMRFGRFQSQSERGGEEKKSLPLPGIELPSSSP